MPIKGGGLPRILRDKRPGMVTCNGFCSSRLSVASSLSRRRHCLGAGVTGNSVPPTFRSGGPSSLGNSVPPPPPPPPPPDRNPWMHKTNYPGPKSLDVVIYTFLLVHKTALLEDIGTDGLYILQFCGLYMIKYIPI